MVDAMAVHYGNHPQVVAWQIDNEFDVRYCDACQEGFRQWLEACYGTIESVNAA